MVKFSSGISCYSSCDSANKQLHSKQDEMQEERGSCQTLSEIKK